MKWIKAIVIAGFAAFVCYGAYDYYRAGFHTRPDLPEGAFSISYKNGMRAILVGVPDERETRRYLGFAVEVPFYLQDAWSHCAPPSTEESRQIASVLEKRDWPGERLEAVCKIAVEEKAVPRGFITTVPKL